MLFRRKIVVEFDPALTRTLDRLSYALTVNLEKIMAKLDALTAEVTAINDTDDAILALIDGLVQQLKDAGTDQGAVDAIVADLEAKRTVLAAAVTTNTPAG
jgi:ABC-type transporter Mla subunit MlaD